MTKRICRRWGSPGMTKQEAERLWQERVRAADEKRLLNERCREYGYITPPKVEDSKSEVTTARVGRKSAWASSSSSTFSSKTSKKTIHNGRELQHRQTDGKIRAHRHGESPGQARHSSCNRWPRARRAMMPTGQERHRCWRLTQEETILMEPAAGVAHRD